jgi:hypothetical protein
MRARSLFAALIVCLAVPARAEPPTEEPDEQKIDRRILERDAQGNVISVDDRVGFASARQWVFSTDAELSLRRTTLTGQKGARTSLSIAPGVDFFILPNLSVGGGVGVIWIQGGDDHGYTITVGPRVGWNFEVGHNFSIWPKLGLSFAHTTIDDETASANGLAINLFAPIMMHPAKYFTVGFGPFLDADVSGRTRATTWGMKLTMGGWFDSRPKPQPPIPMKPALPPPPPAKHD